MRLKHQQLIHALALAKFSNFRDAAGEQHLSQPAFSRSISNLEKSLGAKLFDRTSIGTTPNLYGKAVLRRAASIVAEANELAREVMLLKGLDTGRFNVALALFPAELSGSRAVGKLIRDHPKIECHVGLSDWEHVAQQVLSGAVDVGMGEISAAGDDSRLETERIGLHEFVFYCRKGHPLSGNKSVAKSDIDGFPLTLLRLPSRVAELFPGRGIIDSLDGVKTPSVEVRDLSIARTIVLESDAVSAATPLQIEPWLKTGELEVIPFHKPWMKLDYGFLYRKDRMLSPTAEQFMDNVRLIEKELTSRNRELMRTLFPDK